MSATTQRSFAAGEIAPFLYARTDLARYFIGLRTCRNFLIMRHGGAANRPGTTFRGEVNNSGKAVRLIPFIFNTSQTYILEFGDSYMQVYKNGNQVMVGVSQTVTTITTAAVGVLTYVGADNFANGDGVIITFTVQGSAGPYYHNRFFKVANVDVGANTFELQDSQGNNVNTSAYPAFAGSTATVDRVYKISTPYVSADLSTLNYAQSADVITIVHPTYAPRELSRAADNSWTLSSVTFGPTQAPPTFVVANPAIGVNGPTGWAVTAISSTTGEESLIGYTIAALGYPAAPTVAAPATITWTAAAGASSYRIYRADRGASWYGLIGTGLSGFIDNGITPDYTDQPPGTPTAPATATNPFSSASNYPSAVMYSQGRIFYGGTTNNPSKFWGSQVGFYHNFESSFTIQDSESLAFTLAGRYVSSIKHMIELGDPVILTSMGEYALLGNTARAVTPTAVSAKQYSTNGSSSLAPLIVGGRIIFNQARGGQIRDLAFDFQSDTYHGEDLTIFSSHLFEGYTVSDWAYQQIPQSIIWAARSDGSLIGLTYIREQQMIAWHRHDFVLGTVENVCCVPEGTEDILYLAIKRTINGKTFRSIERMDTRVIGTVRDAIFMDATLSYNGVNAAATTMTLSGGTAWTYDETLTLTASASTFLSGDTGKRVDVTGSDGTIIRCTITAYTSATVVSVQPHKTVPVALRGVATATWTLCVKTVSGLWHLEGKNVSVYADSFVVGNPNNAEMRTIYTVANGQITLNDPYGVIYVGLPITADIETLDIDVAQGETLADKRKLITKLTAFIQKSRGLWSGSQPPTSDATDPLENLEPLKIRDAEGYDSPVSLATDNVEIPIIGAFNNNGRVFVRQVDPLPLTILSLTPSGFVPQAGGQ